jgi:hypothetical protein
VIAQRYWLDRPLDAQRSRAFAAAACVLLLVASGLVLTAGSRTTAPVDAPAVRGDAAAAVAPTLDADAADPLVSDRRHVVRQARRFLRGYLPYLYGQGPADAIRGSAAALRRRLEAARLRVSPAARKRRPRVVRVSAEPLDRGRWHVVATVADGGVAQYPIELLLTTENGAVRVAEVSSE